MSAPTQPTAEAEKPEVKAAESKPSAAPAAAPEKKAESKSAAPAAKSAPADKTRRAEKPEAKAESKPAAKAESKPESAPTESKPAEAEKPAAPEASISGGPAFPLADAPQAPVQRKRGKRHVPEAIAHVTATFNNTIVTFADQEGKVIAWATTGSSGFKGARKGTPYAAQIAAENAGRKAQEHGVETVEVRVRGVGSGRDSAVRAINALGIRIGCIRDVTPVPHNGCRPPKRRRV